MQGLMDYGLWILNGCQRPVDVLWSAVLIKQIEIQTYSKDTQKTTSYPSDNFKKSLYMGQPGHNPPSFLRWQFGSVGNASFIIL